MSRTIVSFHAHPDDEVLLTGGTLARAAQEGHRVVLVVATDGGAGLAATPPGERLAASRLRELRASAAALGVARVVCLGFADSGSGPEPRPGSFATLDPAAEPAAALAQVLLEEHAEVLTIYDPHGGYGHRDHVQVHRAGLAAVELAGTPSVLEATVDRTLIERAVRLLRLVGRVLPVPALPASGSMYTARDELTHRIDVRAQLPAKLAALRAHASQAGGGDRPRTLGLLLRLPGPVARLVLGREWFREVGRTPGRPLLDDVFASLGGGGARPVQRLRAMPRTRAAT